MKNLKQVDFEMQLTGKKAIARKPMMYDATPRETHYPQAQITIRCESGHVTMPLSVLEYAISDLKANESLLRSSG